MASAVEVRRVWRKRPGLPRSGRPPYLKRTGVVVAGVVFVLGGLLLRVTVATSIDLGYQAPVAVLAGWLVRRWTASGGWTDRHSLCLAGGALVGHTAFGVVANAVTLADKLELSTRGLVMVSLLALFGRRRPADADEITRKKFFRQM
ncbi:hypothetical protein N5079_09050 [Planotetraspora sp. A-T 1434]|uniref:hypothetical protein n=1 Tax=Planotetraspora sp. A-T 1434 TaxID=2979219 RepID=UPI0021BF69B6|nr:hypothetical protein [Planotetraspora sp. A-T 1434]MCT9930371.1 hypothetical protein [Planotetraspora sp. A-T 1434]